MKFCLLIVIAALFTGCASVAHLAVAVSTAATAGHLSRGGAFVDSAAAASAEAGSSLAKIAAAAEKARGHAEKLVEEGNGVAQTRVFPNGVWERGAQMQAVLGDVRAIQAAAADAQGKIAEVGAKLAAEKAERASAQTALVALQASAAALEKQEAQAVQDKQVALVRQREIQKDRDAIAGRLNTLAWVLALVAGLLAWSVLGHWARSVEAVAPAVGIGGPIVGGLFVGGAVFTYLRYLL